MVKVINPLFSNEARGRCGGLVYQTGIYGQFCRTHVLQRYRPTDLQKQQNNFFGVAADQWRLLSDEQKAEYNFRARNLTMTGFNLYIKENIEHP